MENSNIIIIEIVNYFLLKEEHRLRWNNLINYHKVDIDYLPYNDGLQDSHEISNFNFSWIFG